MDSKLKIRIVLIGLLVFGNVVCAGNYFKGCVDHTIASAVASSPVSNRDNPLLVDAKRDSIVDFKDYPILALALPKPQPMKHSNLPDVSHLWPTYRHDNTLAGISPIKGGLSTEPNLLWSVSLAAPPAAKENWYIKDFNGDFNYEVLRIIPEESKIMCQNLLGQMLWEVNDMPGAGFYDCRDYAGNGGRGILFRCLAGTQYKWYLVDGNTGARALLYTSHDVYGDDRRIGNILPGVKGQQICAWWDGDDNPVSPDYPNRVFEGYIWSFENGVANPNRRFFVNGVGEEVWVPLCLFVDMDKDGQTETVMISYEEARFYNTQTSAKKAQMHWYKGATASGIRDRKANIAALPLRPGQYPSFLVINPHIPGLEVVSQNGSSATVLWKKVIGSIESQYQSALKIGPGAPDPFIDLDGDGQIEMITSIVNEHGDGKTNLVIFGADAGERLFESPNMHIISAEDLDKDGRLEIFVKSGNVSPPHGAWACDSGNEIPTVNSGDTLHIARFARTGPGGVYELNDIVKIVSGNGNISGGASEPHITAGWIEPGALAKYEFQQPIREQDVRDRIDMMARLGMDTAIIAYTEYNGFYYPSNISFYSLDQQKIVGPGRTYLKNFDVVDTILSQAEKNNMKVFVGLSRAGDLYLTVDILNDNATDARIQNNVNINNQMADELWQRYSKYKSFAGWYIAHEASELDKTTKLIEPIAQHLKSIAPNTRVMLAPNIDNYLTANQIQKSSVDILSYQDGVGAGFVVNDEGHGYYSFNPELSLARIENKWKEVAEMNRNTNKQIWAGLDIWEMDGTCPLVPNHYGCPYSASFSRVKRQMDLASKYVKKISGYAVIELMSDPNYENSLRSIYGFSGTGEKAHDLFRGYKDYFNWSGVANPFLKPQPPELDLQRSYGNVVTYKNPVIWRTTPDSNEFLMKFGNTVWSCRLSGGTLQQVKTVTVHEALGNNPPPPSPAQTYAWKGNTLVTYVKGQEVYRQDKPMWPSYLAPPPIVGELGGKVRVIARGYGGTVLSFSEKGTDQRTLLTNSPAYQSSDHVYHNHMILCDIDDNGSNELLTTTKDGNQPKVVAVDENGNVKLTILPVPNATDLVLMATGSLGSGNGRWITIRCNRLNDTTAVAAYNGKTGRQMWVRESFGVHESLNKSFTASIPTSTYDYNKDGADDLLLISDHFYGIIDVKNNVNLVPPSNNPLFAYIVPAHWTAYGVPMLVDMLHTGKQPQIVIGASWCMLWTVDLSGNPIWHWRLSRDTDTMNRGREGLADLDGDGKIEVVMAQQDGLLRAFGAESLNQKCPKCPKDQPLDVNNHSANPLWQYTLNPPVSDFASADIDGDSKMELLCGTKDGLYALKQSGGACSVLWKKGLGGRIVGSPVIADIDNDGYPEILVTTEDGYLRCLGKYRMGIK